MGRRKVAKTGEANCGEGTADGNNLGYTELEMFQGPQRESFSFIHFISFHKHLPNMYKCQGCSSRSDRQDPCSDGVRHGKTDRDKQGLRRAGALGCRRDWGLSACLGTEAEEPEGRVKCPPSEAAGEGASTKKTTQEQSEGRRVEANRREKVSKICQLMSSFIYSIKLYLAPSECQAPENQRLTRSLWGRQMCTQQIIRQSCLRKILLQKNT